MNMRYAKRSEDTEQINVVSWAGWNMSRYPELKWLFHVPNGGSRNKQEAVKFKQMGVKAGVSDLCLPYPKGSYCGLFVEMKFGNNRQQDTQKEFLADMAAAGHFVATCYSAEEAIKVIEEYLNLSDAVHTERNLNMSIPNNSILKDGKIKNRGEKNKTSLEVEEWLKADSGFDMFVTPVRRSIVAEKSTTAMIPLPKFSKRGIVSQDYRCVVHELLKEMEG